MVIPDMKAVIAVSPGDNIGLCSVLAATRGGYGAQGTFTPYTTSITTKKHPTEPTPLDRRRILLRSCELRIFLGQRLEACDRGL
jgi:hypothetical protein